MCGFIGASGALRRRAARERLGATSTPPVRFFILLRQLMDAEQANLARLNAEVAAPVAEDVPGDLRRAPDEEFEAPDVRVVVSARRGREEDGAPPQSKAPEPHDRRARFPVVRPPAAGRADPGDHGPQKKEAVAGGQGWVGPAFLYFQKQFGGMDSSSYRVCPSTIQRRQSSHGRALRQRSRTTC